MKNGRNLLRQNLSDALINFRREPSEKSERQLVAAFLIFLQGVDHIQWRTKENELIWQFVSLDPHYRFFRLVSSSDLINLIYKRFNLARLRLYLFSNLKYLEDKNERISFLIDALKNDPDKSNRNWALILLAKLNWPQASERAALLWKSRDTVDKSFALKALAYASPDDLEKYIEEASKIECLGPLLLSFIKLRDMKRRNSKTD